MKFLECVCEHLSHVLLNLNRVFLQLLHLFGHLRQSVLDNLLLLFQRVIIVIGARARNRVRLINLYHVVVDLARLCLLHFLNHALATVRIAAAVTEELIRLLMLPAEPKVLRDLVNWDLLVPLKKGGLMELFVASVTEVLVVILAVHSRRGAFLAAALADDLTAL